MEKGNVSPDPNLMKQLLNEKLERKRKDTVGAVAISAEGMTAAAVSSGGVLLKVNGRVGQAAHFGSGCWAEDNVAVTTSGVGEYLVKTFLAQRVSDDLISASSVEDTNLTDSLKTSLKKRFSESPYLGNIEKKDRIAGILGSFVHPEAGVVELFCSHSSPSMVFGFQTEQMKSPETILSRSLDPKSGEFEIKAFMLAKQ
jgi:taspase (threonine aspartase 1)